MSTNFLMSINFQALPADAKVRVESLLEIPKGQVHRRDIKRILDDNCWRNLAKKLFQKDCLFEIVSIEDLDRLINDPQFKSYKQTDYGFLNSLFNKHYRAILLSQNKASKGGSNNFPPKELNVSMETQTKKTEVVEDNGSIPDSQSGAGSTHVLGPRIMATSWAFPYLKDYPRSAMETFSKDFRWVLGKIDNFLDHVKSNIPHPDSIRNWNLLIEDIFNDTEVWFVTEQEIGSEVPVYNRFTRSNEILQIPCPPGSFFVIKDVTEYYDPNLKDEVGEWDRPNREVKQRNPEIMEQPRIRWYIKNPNPDTLGLYIPKTGTIFIFIDRIDHFIKKELIFTIVLLHEFIHAALDLSARRTGGRLAPNDKWEENIAQGNKIYVISEESIDNAIVLLASGNDPEVKDFIEKQPEEYKNSLLIHGNDLESMTSKLIRNKLQS